MVPQDYEDLSHACGALLHPEGPGPSEKLAP